MNASTTLHSATRSGLQRLVMTLSLARPMGRRTFANIGAAILVMSGFGAGFVSAAPITPTTVKATSYWFAVDGNHNNLINGSGLSGGGSVLTQTHDNASNASTMWHGGPSDGGLGGPVGTPPQVSTQILEFDLGASYALTKTHVWNHNQPTVTGRGVKDVNIWTSPDTTSAFTKLGDFVLNQAAGAPGLAAQVLTTAASNVRRVQFRISTVWNGASHEYVGMSEVRFEGSATPAPTVTSISPTSGSIAGGTSVIITGTDFIGASGVTIGGTNATSFTVDSATQITATTPAHALGAVSVLVTTPGGTNAANTLFTYTPPNTAPSFTLPAGVDVPAGETWTARDSNRDWHSITSSGDGSKLAAVVWGGQIYTSTDSGATWTARESNRDWSTITSSADGSKLVAVVKFGRIYTSTDSGVSWTARETSRAWESVTSSADGGKLAAVANHSGQIYTSTDSGVTWTARETNRDWRTIASSADGSKLVAAVGGGKIYTSTDSGVTWTARDSDRSWFAIASSGDGSKLAATVGSGQIYTSTDSGATWTARDSNRGWAYISSSADGSKLAATVGGGQIYTSTDSGATWTARDSNRGWWSITSSADGSKLAVGVRNGQIYTSVGSTTPHNVSVGAGSGPQTTPAFATAISPGPVADAGQTVSFTVNNNNTALFTAQPGITSNGTLTFTPGSTSGVATVTVTAVDDGGTAGGGADTSAAQTFTITVTNDAPTDISLTPATIAENNAANATVGSLSATDANAGQTHSFSLVSGTGSTDNASFTIDGTALKLTPSANFEVKNSYSLRVQADDGMGGTFAKAFTVTITDVNEAPTDIALSNATLAENNAANASVGTLSASGDPDAGAVHTFSLVNGMGDADNAAFTIDGSALKLIPSANFEVKNSYSLRVEASDGLGGTFAKSLVISITDVNEAPSDLTVTPSSIAENNAANATVGTLASVDEDAGASALFSLVAGAGDTDNGSFSIDGTSLKLIPVADFEIKSSYSLRVQADDGNGGTFEKALTVTITDVNDAPTDITLTPATIAENNAANATVGALSATDADAGQTHTFTKVTGTGDADNSSFTIVGSDLKLTPVADFETKSSYSLRVQADDGNGGTFEKAVTVTITNVNEAPTISDIASLSINEDAATSALAFTIGDVDAGTTFSVSGSSDNTTLVPNGNIVFGGSGTSRTVTVTPAANLSGSAVITVTVSDGTLSASDTFTLTVNEVNDAPSFTLPAGVDVPAGETWTARDSNRQWSAITSSADGSKLAAVETVSGRIYTSTDSGATWTPRESNRYWFSITSSADGSKLAAVDHFGKIYTSMDSGVNWTARDSDRAWVAITSSADGSKLAAVVQGGGLIYTSTDSGETWTPRETNRNWHKITSSADGSKLAATVSGGQIYTSTDSGVSWTPRESNRGWFSITSSADGSKLAAVVFGGQIYTSTDSGVNWTARESTRNWLLITSSADGSKLAALEFNGRIYTSTDSGATWTARESNRNWNGITSSADGSKLAATVNGGRIYTSVGGPGTYNLSVGAGSGPQTTATFATAISPGPVAEAGQTVSFTVNSNNSSLFTAQPAIASNGTLTFTPGSTSGVATVTVTAVDDGGTAGGGADTSAAQTFTITVTNDAPTDISLTPATIAENNAANATVGSLSATDANAGQTHTFTKVTGMGDTDNGSFTIDGSDLKLTPSADFETKASYSLRVQADDGEGGTFAKALTVTITDVNEAPTDIALSNATLAENNAANASVGTLSASGDPDAGAVHTFSLVNGMGDADNAAFTIDGSALKLIPSANFEVKNSYSLRVEASDGLGGTFAKSLVISITDVNEAPSDLTLTPSNIAENNAANASVGTLAAVDEDAGASALFSLVAGAGDTDNGSFSIDGTSLKLIPVADFEIKSSYSLRVQADDGNGGTFAKALTVTITDVNDAPTDITLTPATIAENNAANATVGALSATDADAGQTHTFTKVTGTGDADNSSFTIVGSDLKLTPVADFETKSSYSLRVQADDGNGGTFEKAVTVTITNVNEAPTLSAEATKYLSVGGFSNNTNAVRLMRLNSAGTAIASSTALPSNTSGSSTYMISYNATSGQMILGNSFFHLPTFLSSSAFTLNLNGSLPNNSPWQAHLPSGKFVAVQRVGGTSGPIMTFNPATNAISNGGSGSGGIPEASWLYNGFLYSADEGLGVYRIAVATDGSTTGGASSVSPNPITGRSIPQGDGGYTETSRAAVAPDDGTALLSTGHNLIYLFDLDTAPASGDYIQRNVNDYVTTSGPGFTALPNYTDVRGIVYDSSAGVFYVQGSLGNASGNGGDFILRVSKTGDVTAVAQELAGDLIYSTSSSNGFGLALASLTPNVFTLAENSALNTNVGTATAADPDASTTLSNWTITGGNTGDAFAINPTTGVITVATASAIDFETNPSFTLSVTVSDGTQTSAAGTVTIAITNVNEAPTDLALNPSSIPENNAENATIGTLTASGDPDAGAAHTFSLAAGAGDTDNGNFVIDGSSLKFSGTAAATTNGLHFDGSNDQIILNGFTAMTAYTIETWVKPSDTGGNRNIITGGSGGWSHQLRITGGRFEHYTYDGNIRSIRGSTVITPGQWYHVAITAVNGGQMRLFVNGVEDVTPTGIGTLWTGLNAFNIGGDFGAGYANFFGTLDEVRIWRNVARTGTQIQASRNAELTGTEPGLNTYFKFNQGSAGGNNGGITTVTATTGANATLQNFALNGATSNWVTGASVGFSGVANFETKSSYSIRVLANDGNGGTFAKVLTINVTNVNEPPTDITLSNSSIAENNAANATVGTAAATGDPDAGAMHTFDLVSGTGDTDNAAFTLSSAGVLSINDPTNYEVKTSYSIRVRATDNGSPGLSYEKAFTISITNVNEAVLAVALTGSSVTEHLATNTTVGTFSSTDTDTGNSHSYSLVSGTGSDDNASFNISGNTLRTTAVFDFETKSSYTIRVRSTDQGGLFTEQDFAITILDANDPPSDLALSTAPIAENNTPGATVGTFSTTDENVGQSHTYTLVGGTGSADNGSFIITGNELKLNVSANFEVKSSYAIRVRTTDNGAPFNLFYEEAFTLTITDVQEAPWQISYQGGGPAGVIYANGLTARVVYSSAAVATLAHADAMLVNGQNIASQFTGPISLVDFADSNTPGRFPGVLPFPGQSVLTAADNLALQVTGTIVVPTTGTYTFAVRSDDGSRIKIDGTTVFTDNTTHGETEFYTPVNLTAGVHTLDFVFFEGGGGGQVELFVATGSHGGYNGNFSLLQSYPLGIDENTASGSTVTTFNATDDAGDTHDFTLVSGTGDTDNGAFTLTEAGVLTNNVIPDLETKSSYSIRVRATDGGGLFSEAAFIVIVNNVNEAVLSVALTGSSVNENAAINTTVGTFSSTDTDTGNTHSYTLVAGTGSDDNASFNISGSTLRTSAVFDFETKNSYSIRVRSTDQGGLFLEDEFTITVNDTNDAPTNISLSATAVDENDDPNTTVGLLSATDADPGDTHTFALVAGTGSTDNGSFSISDNQLILTPSANFEVKSSYSIRLRTTDSGTGGLTFDKVFNITINNLNDAPTDIALTATSIAENMASGSTVGLISGSDADAGQAATLVFTLVAGVGADDNASFEVDGNQLNTTEVFNFEADTSYTIRLRATDTGGEFVEEAFTIAIADVNDAPILTSNGGGATGTDTIAENTTAVTTVTADDVDVPAQTLSYSITGGADMALFTIVSGTGELSFIAAPNYEDPDDLDNDNDYEVTVTATDNGTGALTDSQALTVTVTDANDAPIITSNGGGATGTDSMAENTTAVTTVTATDADLPAQTLTYSITGGADSALFSIDSDTGELSFTVAPDFENPGDQGDNNEYEVTVTVTDDGTGLLTDAQALTVTVTDGNDAPAAINISASMIGENSGVDAVVGTLTAVDEDNPANGQTHVFTLVSGAGAIDNASFTIESGELKTAENFDFETKASYSIRVEATDDGTPGASYEQVLVIMVGDVDIDIEDPDGRDLVSGVSDSYVFTDLQAMGTSSTARVFTISNPGTAPLTGIEVTINGTQSGSFELDTSATAETIDPGETTTFTVVFAPAYFGEREAVIQVAHNGDEDNPFELGVTGMGATLVVTLAGGEVTVTDYGDRTDALSLAVSGTDLVLTSGVMLSNAGTGSGTGTVTIPLASITNGITVNIGLGGGTVTFGDMTGYTGPLTVAPVVSGDLAIRVNGPVNVGPHPILFNVNRTVTISGDLQASGAGLISVTTRQGIAINSAANVSVENGDLTLSANQALPALDGTFTGIDITGASQVSSTGSGQVTLNGKSGQDAGFGVTIDGDSTVTGGTTGTLTINGVSNAAGTSRYGLTISGADTTITTLGANISLTGTGGGSPAGNKNHGVVINSGASVLAVGNANLTITGSGGVEGQGVRIRDDAGLTLVAVADGDLTITGHEGSGVGAIQGFHYVGGKSGRIESTGSGDLVFNADTVEMTGAGTSKGTIQTAGGGSLTFKPLTASTSIGLGGGAGSLSLTDAALAYFGDGFASITIGDTAAGSGNITINTATFSDPVLLAGGTIYNAGGTDVTLTAGDTLTLKGTVAPGASPGKLTVSGKAALAANSVLQQEISGLIAGTQNDQIVASETVDIGSNVTLNLVQVGGFVPTGTESFTLIQRSGGTGTFAGMPEGHVFTNLFGSGQVATLTYLAGTSGKDVALVMGALIPDIKIEQPVGNELVDGIASVTMGKAAVTKRGITRTFTVTNTGNGAVTDLALSLSGANAADFAFSSLSTTTLADGASTTFSVTFTPSALGTRTAMLHVASNVNGSKNPYDIILAGTGIATEATKPTLAIASPATSAKVNEGTAVVTGTVKDASGIALVEAKLGTGAYVEAALNLDTTGTSGSYSLALNPAPGLNSLSVKATDTAGNVTTVTRSFTYVVLRPLTLATAGTGSGTAVISSPSTANTAALQVGSVYSLRATAAAGSFFNGWTSPNGSVTIPTPLATTLTFTMVEGAQITANFITNPFTTDLTGSYAGLIKAATGTTAAKSNTGLFTASLASTGSFSGKVNLDGVAKSVSGTFNPNTGNCTVSVLNGATTWSLSLHLDLTGGTDRITGTLTQVTGGIPGDVSDVTAERAAFSALATVPVANRGTYTVVLPARPSQTDNSVVYPLGDGVGQLTVVANGTVSLKATLADGRAITATGALSQSLTWPIFVGFTSRTGSLAGVATLDAAQDDSDVTATNLAWYLNAGASTYFPAGWPNGIKTDLVGALYSVPVGSAVLPGLGLTNAATGNAELTFSSGNLGSTLTKYVNITTASVASRAPATDSSFTVALTKTSGAFYGSFTHTGGGKASYTGTVLQKGANAGGYGYFLLAPAAAGNAGAVTLQPK